MKAQIGRKAPLLQVSDWVQGVPLNFDQLSGRVLLVEVFQLNCPGLFFIFLAAGGRFASTYSLPVAMDCLRKRQVGVSCDLIATFINDLIPGLTGCRKLSNKSSGSKCSIILNH